MEAARQRLSAPMQPAGQLKRDDRAHAVAEERERLAKKRNDLRTERLDQRCHRFDRWFTQSSLAARETSRDDGDIGQGVSPGPIHHRAAPCIRETEEYQLP